MSGVTRPDAQTRDAGPWSLRAFAVRHHLAAVTLRGEIAAGRLVAQRIGARRLAIYAADEAAWLATRRVAPTPHARARLAERLAYEARE